MIEQLLNVQNDFQIQIKYDQQQQDQMFSKNTINEKNLHDIFLSTMCHKKTLNTYITSMWHKLSIDHIGYKWLFILMTTL
jgi:hypothetical protein